jgi:hypothetical protein
LGRCDSLLLGIVLYICNLQVNNFTFGSEYGFSPDNLLATDQRGFKTFVLEEANEFVSPSQLRLSSVVKTISWSRAGVTVVLEDGSSITGDYALCTFSLGVLQNDDIKFEPNLPRKCVLVTARIVVDLFPAFKLEAIASMTMGTFTKIFLQFPEKFWFDNEVSTLQHMCWRLVRLSAVRTVRRPGTWAIPRLAEFGPGQYIARFWDPGCDGYRMFYCDTAVFLLLFHYRVIFQRELKPYLMTRCKKRLWAYFVPCIPTSPFQTPLILASLGGMLTRCIVDHIQIGLHRSSASTTTI